MQPDLQATRRQLTLRYAAFVAGLLLVFALGVYGQVSRSSQDLLRRQAEQLAATAAAELPLLHHEIDEARAAPSPRRAAWCAASWPGTSTTAPSTASTRT